MNNINFEQLEQLLAENKFSEAKPILESFFLSELTPEERGEILVNFALVYAKVKTKINQEYIDNLDIVLTLLRDVNDAEADTKKEIDIAAVRSQIADL